MTSPPEVRIEGCWSAPYYADELVYAAVDTVIFLDYPKLLVMWRVLRRTLRIELSYRTRVQQPDRL
jgi:hypothetical protein